MHVCKHIHTQEEKYMHMQTLTHTPQILIEIDMSIYILQEKEYKKDNI